MKRFARAIWHMPMPVAIALAPLFFLAGTVIRGEVCGL